MLTITHGRGFQMKFPNGVIASVQWGTANYCDRSSFNIYDYGIEMKTEMWESPNAEVAAWLDNDNGVRRNWVTRDLYPDDDYNDDVIARLDVTAVMDFLNRCQNF